MAHFDRFDICSAWNLYLQHHWDDSTREGRAMLARHSKLRRSFKPSHAEEFVSGLSENALEIYAQLCANAGTLQKPEHEIANTRSDSTRENLFRMWAGSATNSGLLGRTVYVWADHFDQAFEYLVEWLDDNAPGCLVSHARARQAAVEYAMESDRDVSSFEAEDYEQVEAANEWTVIGHTSLKTGGHIASHEWGGDDVENGSDEYETVLLAGTGVEVSE